MSSTYFLQTYILHILFENIYLQTSAIWWWRNLNRKANKSSPKYIICKNSEFFIVSQIWMKNMWRSLKENALGYQYLRLLTKRRIEWQRTNLWGCMLVVLFCYYFFSSHWSPDTYREWLDYSTTIKIYYLF